MERIDSFFAPIFHQFPEQDGEKKKVKKNKSQRTSFSDRLESLETEHTQGSEGIAAYGTEDADLEVMLDEIHGWGERIKDNPSMESLRRYREAVRNFLRYVVGNSYSVEKRSLTRFQVLQLRKGDRPVLTVIRIIDEKLEKLAAEIFRGQKEQLDILHRVDEIYGLLVDLIR